MSKPPRDVTVAERARWLAELSKALDDAQALASELGLPRMPNPEAVELCARLAAARAQVKGLRLARVDDAADELGPKWSTEAIWPNRSAQPER